MKKSEVLAIVRTAPKGANIVLEWTRDAKTRKGTAGKVEKHVRMVGRIGVEYDNLNDVQEKRESGELPPVNQGLPWGEWEEYPFLIAHKGKHYLRMYKGTSVVHVPKVEWRLNGQPVPREMVEPFLLASETAEKEGDCFTCSVENLERVWKE